MGIRPKVPIKDLSSRRDPMKHLKYLALICIVTNPQLAMAVEEVEHKYTDKEQITFSLPTMAAFDHSGKMVAHKTLSNGTEVADYNGSMGNVTVARLGPDGRVETYCTSSIEAAKSFMSGEGGRKPAARLSTPVMEKNP